MSDDRSVTNTAEPCDPLAQEAGRDVLDVLARDYASHCAEAGENPFVSPILRLALDVGKRMESGTWHLPDIQAAVQCLALDGLVNRAHRLGVYLGDSGSHAFYDILDAAAYRNAGTPEDARSLRTFEDFRAQVERIHYGFVFTAHPTFTMTAELSRTLAACAHEQDPVAVRARLAKAAAVPFSPPTLAMETALSLEAIDHLQESLEAFYKAVFDVARTHWPGQWHELRPTLFTVASWVGFDLDGRNDIYWTTTLANRLDLQIRQSESLRCRLEDLSARVPAMSDPLAPAHDLLRRAESASRAVCDSFRSYQNGSDPDHQALQAASRAMIRSVGDRLVSPAPLIKALEDAVQACRRTGVPDSGLRDLLALVSEVRRTGISRAEVHFRINAAQIHNALRRYVNLTTHPADPRFRQSYMDKLLRRFRDVGSLNIHFGNILEEQASARRLFMLIQQVVQYVDDFTPVRFLIAETESSFTVMAALYLAHRFGVTDHVDICPLFETERALRRGSRIMEHLLEVPEFRAYIQRRGRLCVQTGYSDAGRYIGQAPASGSIERLKERIVRLLKDSGLESVDVLFFDTHGESLGRGGHPESLQSRLAYIAPPALRGMIAAEELSCIQEDSFQGGDGYVHFLSPACAQAALGGVARAFLTGAPYPYPSEDDLYYRDRAAMTEFLTIIKTFQVGLMQDPDYGALLSAFGTNLMRGTGSRAVRREYDDRGGKPQALDAREIRAIPHNAILAQMGFLVNTVSGLGHAVETDPAAYRTMMAHSARFRSMMALVHRGAALSSPETLKAYIDSLDPVFWLARAAQCETPAGCERYDAVARYLERFSGFSQMIRMFRKIWRDYTAFGHCDLAATQGEPETRTPLACLHAIRIALIHQIFLRALEIPYYSPQHDMSRDVLLQYAFTLDIPRVLRALKEIFPVQVQGISPEDYGEISDCVPDDVRTYAFEQERLVSPLQDLHTNLLAISTAISHHMGFTG